MRVSRRGAQLLAVALLLLPAGARANELLVMPYSCTMVGGQPLLAPGPEQSHRIIGSRDQRRFSACSPVNPDMCRNWTVHRFDLDCDGARVPWVSVVAATNEGSRRAWLLDGRLVLRMGPGWSLPLGDPCARARDLDDRLGPGRTRRSCADRLAMAPPPVVEMPFGYAPMLGIDGIFVKAAPSVSGAPPPRVSAAPVPAPSAPPGPLAELFPPEPQRAEPQRTRSQPAEPTGRPVLPPQPLDTAAQSPPRLAAPLPPPEPPKSAPATPATRPAAADAAKAAQTEAKSEAKPPAPTPNLGPRVVALSPPASNPAAPANPAPAATSNTAVEGKPVAANAAPAPSTSTSPASTAQDARQAGPAPGSATGLEEGAPGISIFSVFRTTTTGVIVAFAGLALGLLTAFALARRREYMSDTRRPPRDLAAVSLDGKRARSRPPVANVRGTPLPQAAAPAAGRMPEQAAATGAVAAWDDRMPRTRAEALQMLGIGVAPTASDAALKKIVDGLRQSWHPDLATDENDRVLRELRSKQINAAWDLLRSQRAEV